MFDAIIPLRSGSKGIKNKNLKKINKDTLINHLIKKLIKIKDINRIFILTDSNNYKKKILKSKKINLDYIRSKKLSKDSSVIYDLIFDFIKWSNERNLELNKILLFQATSPLLQKKEIHQTINFIKRKKLKSLFHVTEMIEHPYECIKGLSKNWKYLSKIKKVNRQNYEKFYFINGSLYFFTIKFFQKYKKFYNLESFAYKVDKINFVDIDTKFDFEIAKKLLNLKIRS